MREETKKEKVSKVVEGGSAVGEEVSHLMIQSLLESFQEIGLGTTALEGLLKAPVSRDGRISPKERDDAKSAMYQSWTKTAQLGIKLTLEHGKLAAGVASTAAGYAIPGLSLIQRSLALGDKIRNKDNIGAANEVAKILLTGTGIILLPFTMGGSTILLGIAAGLDGAELLCKIGGAVNDKLYPGVIKKELFEMKTLSNLNESDMISYAEMAEILALGIKQAQEHLLESQQKISLLDEAKKAGPQSKIGQETIDWSTQAEFDKPESTATMELPEIDETSWSKSALMNQSIFSAKPTPATDKVQKNEPKVDEPQKFGISSKS